MVTLRAWFLVSVAWHIKMAVLIVTEHSSVLTLVGDRMMKKLILFMTAALIAGAANVGYAAHRPTHRPHYDCRPLGSAACASSNQ